MEEIKFYAKCIFPTTTFKGGKYYEVVNEEDYDITVINDNGNSVKTGRYRFDKIISKKEEIKGNEAVCINSGAFKNLTKGKKYTIINETKTRFNVINDLGKEALYSKKYFERKAVAVKKVAVAENKNEAVCLYPIANELSFKKGYKILKEEGDYITVKSDNGKEMKYFKKRFRINK